MSSNYSAAVLLFSLYFWAYISAISEFTMASVLRILRMTLAQLWILFCSFLFLFPLPNPLLFIFFLFILLSYSACHQQPPPLPHPTRTPLLSPPHSLLLSFIPLFYHKYLYFYVHVIFLYFTLISYLILSWKYPYLCLVT